MQLCSQANCGKEAISSYTWEWGESGVCCAEHQFTLNQTAGQISRTISFAPLSLSDPPLERTERVQLKARALVLEEELQDAKNRGAALYQENLKLAQTARALTVRDREAQAQISDLNARCAKYEEQLRAKENQVGELSDELDQLRTVAALVDDQTKPSAARNVVDG